MTDDLQAVRDAIRAGDRDRARLLLRSLLEEPTAETWYLASQVANSRDQTITFLRRALELDPWHGPANRTLLRIEGVRPVEPGAPAQGTQPAIPPAELLTPGSIKMPAKRKRRKTAADRQAEGRKFWTRLGCLASILFSISCSVFTMNAIGVMQGMMTTVNSVTGGPTPVLYLDDIPLVDAPAAPARVPPAQSEPASDRDTDILDHGYAHEYRFDARRGEQYVIYIQFLSLSANRVSRNIAVLDPDGDDIFEDCERGAILEGDNNVTLSCIIPKSGTYSIRVLGRGGESTGAYFVGVERLHR